MTMRSLVFYLIAVLIGTTTSFAAAPAEPTLSSPTNGSNVGGYQIPFKWNIDPDVWYYYLYIAKDQNFSQMVVDTVAFLNPGGTYGTYNLSTLNNGQSYYWKMAAMNVYGYSPFSETWSVVNGLTTGLPTTPTLWYPGNGVDVNDSELTLMWYADRATDYYLQVATTSQFTSSTIIFGQWIGNNTIYLISGLLNYGETYYWRVKAKNSYGESAYSSYQSFRYFDSLACTSTYGSGIGVTNNSQSHIDTCNANGGYYLYDISRRTGQQAGHDHAGAMHSASAIKTKHFYGFIYDADNVWSNNSSYELRPLVDGHVYAAKVYDYLYDNTINPKGWSLNSYDGNGASMVSTAEKPCYDTNKTEANWDGAKVIYYASCDGAAKSFAGALDWVAHHWGYAVTDKAGSGLYRQYESGALRVAFSDWLAATIENYYDPGNWNWTIGEDILNIQRDLSNPKSYSHPDTYKGLYYYDTTYCTPTISNDYCYVRTNSGVPNKMFYLLSQGGTLNSVTVQGIGITEAMRIAYIANRDHWLSNATFRDALIGMIQAANNDQNIIAQVKNAWAAVGAGLPIISTSASPAVGGMTTGDGDYEWGQSVTVTATPNTGYAFDKWTEDGFTVSSDASYTFTASESRNLVAHFVERAPYAEAIPSSYAFTDTCPGKSTETATIELKNVDMAPLDVRGASLSAASPDFSIISNGCSNTLLAPGATCSVSVSFAPGSVGDKAVNLVFEFGLDTNPPITVPLSGKNRDLSLYTITATAGGGGVISPSGVVQVCQGDNQTFYMIPDFGYHNWDIRVDGVPQGTMDSYPFDNVSKNWTIEATFVADTYTVTPSAGPNGAIDPPNPQTVPYGSTRSFTIAPTPGYHIESVTGCGGRLSGNTYTTGTIMADCTITASFAINTYTVTPSSEANGSFNPSIAQTVNSGSTASFTITPNPGYHIDFATGCGGTLSGSTYTTGAITANCTVTASFAADASTNTYTLTVTKSGMGAINVVSAPYGISCGLKCSSAFAAGTTVTLEAAAGPGTTFTGWSGGGCSGTGDCTLTLNNDTNVTASFTAPPSAVSTASAGHMHTVALRADGSLWAWGYNQYGQLGDGTAMDKLSPTKIGVDTNWAAISAGGFHIKTDGTSWAWGYNGNGQLGDGTTTDKLSPTKIGMDTDWAAVATGLVHTVALKTNGTLWAWGHNYYGQLGDGTTIYKLSPIQIGTDTDWAAISANLMHTVALKKNGTLWAWGANGYGQLGDGTTEDRHSPVQIGTDTDWATITAGGYHNLAIKKTGTLWAWGLNNAAQLGFWDGTTIQELSPVQIGADTNWETISAGTEHSVALKSNGTLWSWGLNVNGQLGDGTFYTKLSPVQITTDTDWIVISAGYRDTLGLRTDGTLWGWGSNAYGQLGDGTTIDRYVPIWTLGRDDFPRTITATAGNNGSISPSGAMTVSYGAIQTFNVAPDTGYHVTSVTGCGGTLSGNTYTTGAITANCTVTASFAINTYTLTVAKSGAGSATVTSNPAGIGCGSDCSEVYSYGSVITLTASANANSTFTGWSGGGCSGTGDCTVIMTADTSVTATFGCSASPVRILGKADYSTLQAAYNVAVDGDTILSRGITLTENLSADMNKSVTIEGGYTCGYSSSPGVTSLSGSMSINNGTVNIKNFNLQY